MDFIESIKMATKTLVANKLRSSLTMFGIIIGNAAVIATIGVGEGAQNFISGQIESLGTNVLFIAPGSQETRGVPGGIPQTLVLADAKAIATQVPDVEGVSAELNGSELVRYGNKNFSALIFGTTPDFLFVRNFEVAKGRFLTELDIQRSNQVVALGADLAEALFGDANPIGEKVRIKNVSLEVIGVMKPKGSSFGTNYDETALVPITTMANQIAGRRSPYGLPVSFIFVAVDREDKMAIAQFQIENLLRLRHKITDEDDFYVRSQKDLMSTLGAITGALTVLLAAVASISLVVGGIGIMNIMLVSVTERTQEIGLRKAIGASQQDILIQFIIEAVILSVAGGAIGTGIGVGTILAIAQFTPFEAGVSGVAIALATGVSGGIGLFFGVVPAKRAAQLDPIVALRSE
ncbi:ABC transporter permease [Phormidium sp. CCY1219]|uniref:ABC transporter permease n=1 Tax=Phormidium sp. CCY1219 TaxID=2886104 RepID=UPI002D1F1443|nr:ABC transporter permease [Phormidium sp. CCY1219]MEB3828189.1 ABC transporter permease [Phormidium sp. CCY1219]